VNAWKIILATFLIFGTGMVTGGLLTHRFERSPTRVPETSLTTQTNNAPGLARVNLLRGMEVQLDLKPDQRQVIDKILRDGEEHARKIGEPIQPALREEAQKTLDEFRAALTPQQQTRFDDLMKRPSWPPRRGPSYREYPGDREKGERGPPPWTNLMWPTNGMPRFGMTNGMPRFGPTNGMPRFGMTNGSPRFGSTNGMPRFGRP
jgi:hypothetical protein